LRVLLARLDETGWLDQLEQPHVPLKKRDEQLLIAAHHVHDAIHACADEPTAQRHLSVLDALWQGNELLLARADRSRVRPIPPMPAGGWERVLEDLFRLGAEARIARALASIGWDVGWPLACQILPVEYLAGSRIWRIPDQPLADRVPWRGLQPEREFARLFWRRWLDAIRRDRRDALPFGATRWAPLGDVLALLAGRLDLRRVQSYCSALLGLDWSRTGTVALESERAPFPTPTTYAVVRLWLDAGVRPPRDRRPSWDASVAQCLLRGDPEALRVATRLAGGHLQVVGLPSLRGVRRTGRSVARPEPVCTREEARRMAMAILVPVDAVDTDRLARRLWIVTGEESRPKEEVNA
jgi:CRISPR-associated protein Csx17